MSDLISRSALLKEFEEMNAKGTSDLWHITGIKAFIENKPTAYDVDKVVKQLKDYSMWKEFMIYELTHREREIIARAIEIVKGGGVNESENKK